MRYFLIDDLRAEETKRLCEHLDAMDLGAGLDGIYWLPIPAHMLSAVQKEHESQCGPYVMALECEETCVWSCWCAPGAASAVNAWPMRRPNCSGT